MVGIRRKALRPADPDVEIAVRAVGAEGFTTVDAISAL
jgi:hypothetical protein